MEIACIACLIIHGICMNHIQHLYKDIFMPVCSGDIGAARQKGHALSVFHAVFLQHLCSDLPFQVHPVTFLAACIQKAFILHQYIQTCQIPAGIRNDLCAIKDKQDQILPVFFWNGKQDIGIPVICLKGIQRRIFFIQIHIP